MSIFQGRDNFFHTFWPKVNKFYLYCLKPLQNKKGQKIWGTREKSSLFPYKRTAFFTDTPNFFGPSYFEATLPAFFCIKNWSFGFLNKAGDLDYCVIANQSATRWQVARSRRKSAKRPLGSNNNCFPTHSGYKSMYCFFHKIMYVHILLLTLFISYSQCLMISD